jgi:hypothetical protein
MQAFQRGSRLPDARIFAPEQTRRFDHKKWTQTLATAHRRITHGFCHHGLMTLGFWQKAIENSFQLFRDSAKP